MSKEAELSRVDIEMQVHHLEVALERIKMVHKSIRAVPLREWKYLNVKKYSDELSVIICSLSNEIGNLREVR